MDPRKLLPMVPAMFRPLATLMLNRFEALEARQAAMEQRLSALEAARKS